MIKRLLKYPLRLKTALAATITVHSCISLAGTGDKDSGINTSAKAGVEALSYGHAFSVIFSLLVVLAILFACAWVLRRGRGVMGVSDQKIAVTSQLSLGVKEKILLLRVGEENILVGYAGNNLRTLHSWQGDVPPTVESERPVAGFADYLSQLTGKGGKA